MHSQVKWPGDGKCENIKYLESLLSKDVGMDDEMREKRNKGIDRIVKY